MTGSYLNAAPYRAQDAQYQASAMRYLIWIHSRSDHHPVYRAKCEGWKQYKPGQSRHQRGYGSKWDSIRARVLKRDKGLCQLCLRSGVVREATFWA
jgi:hypothetical protein